MRTFYLFILLTFAQASGAQFLNIVNEAYIAERELGHKSFFQADFDGDGLMEFIANSGLDVIVGRLEDLDIQVIRFIRDDESSTGRAIVRYEDANGDGKMELYIWRDDLGLVQFDTATFVPIDTITVFEEIGFDADLALADSDGNGAKEWIGIDYQLGLFAVDPISHEMLWNNPLIDEHRFIIEQLDTDTPLEIVLIKNFEFFIVDMETFAVEYSVEKLGIRNMKALDTDGNGDLELVYFQDENMVLYDHIDETEEVYHMPFTFDPNNLIPYQLDADPAIEFIVSQDNDNKLGKIDTYPLRSLGAQTVTGVEDLGFYLDRSYFTEEPDELLFSVGDYQVAYAGLVRVNVATNVARLTNRRALPNTLDIHRRPNGSSLLLTRPAQGRPYYITLLELDSFHTERFIRLENVFEFPFHGFDDPVYSFPTRDPQSDLIAFSHNSKICLYDLATNTCSLVNNLDFDQWTLDDLDYNGTVDLLTGSGIDDMKVYEYATGTSFNQKFTTLPVQTYFGIQTGQLTPTREKEIFLIDDNEIIVLNGSHGGLLRIIKIGNRSLNAVTAYSDGAGTYYMAIINPDWMYIYNYTNGFVVDSFRFQSEDWGAGLINTVPYLQSNGTLRQYITVQSDSFKVFTTDGDLLFRSGKHTSAGDNAARILVEDLDADFRADVITSGYDQYITYEFAGPVGYYRPFHLATSSPAAGTTFNAIQPFILSFTEAVDLSTVQDQIIMSTTTIDTVPYTVEEIDHLTLRLTPLVTVDSSEIIQVAVYGSLRSQPSRFLDTNYDDLALLDDESPIILWYSVDNMVSTVDLASLGIRCWPNPATDFIEIMDQAHHIKHMELLDNTGTTFFSGNEQTIPIHHLSPGNYRLRITLDNGHSAVMTVVKI